MTFLASSQLVRACVAATVITVSAPIASAQTPDVPVPVFRVDVRGIISEDFHILLWKYADLRLALEQGLLPLAVTPDPAEFRRAELALARRIRASRGPAQGALFTPPISDQFKRVLVLVVTAGTLVAIMDDNPGEFAHDINGDYPKDRTLSTVPANVLAVLPDLPPDVQYRFLGRHLVLHDTRANVILDRVVCALKCGPAVRGAFSSGVRR